MEWINQYMKDAIGDWAWATIAFWAILFVAWYFAKAVRKLINETWHSPAIANLASVLFKVFAAMLAVYVALRILQLDGVAFSLLAGAGVAGIVLGFALQDIVANFMAGIILALQRPFRVGHLVSTNNVYGVVRNIHLRSTEIETLDGQLVHIPNKSVLLDVVSDYNYIPYRRVDVAVGVGYDADLRRVEKVAERAISQLELRESSRPIEVFFSEFGKSSINIEIRFWVRFKNEIDYLQARSDAICTIQESFADAGIEIPYPITTVYDGDSKAYNSPSEDVSKRKKRHRAAV